MRTALVLLIIIMVNVVLQLPGRISPQPMKSSTPLVLLIIIYNNGKCVAAATWKDIPAANEVQYTIENVECTSDGK